MIKKTLFALFLIPFASYSQDISVEQAMENALTFNTWHRVQGKGQSNMLSLAYVPSINDNGNSEYYVFNYEGDNGFVIMSGSSKTATVLGYSDHGHFDYLQAPTNMKGMLENYATEIKSFSSATNQTCYAAPIVQSSIRPSIAPLLGETRWGQDAPYNGLCTNKSVTGCVATAMAQVMYYYKWPKQGNGSNQYNDKFGLESADFSQSVYDWDNMLPFYDESSTQVQKDAVAKLMNDVGISVNTQYATTSTAYTAYVASALKKYFGYDNTAKRLMRSCYSRDEWDDILYTELQEGRPIVFEGRSNDGGHCFLLDGYGKDRYYHINWGWDGMCNGYFLLTALLPSNQGTGGSSMGNGYSAYQAATIGIQPKKDDTSIYIEPMLNASRIYISNYERTGKWLEIEFKNFTNQSAFDCPFKLYIDVLDMDSNFINRFATLDYYDGLPVEISQIYNNDFTLKVNDLDTLLPDGDYQIKVTFECNSEPGILRDVSVNFTQYRHPRFSKKNGLMKVDNGYMVPNLRLELTGPTEGTADHVFKFQGKITNEGAEYYGPIQFFTTKDYRTYSTSSEIYVIDINNGESTTLNAEIRLPNTSGEYDIIAIASQESGAFILPHSIQVNVNTGDGASKLTLVKEITPKFLSMPANKICGLATLRNDGGGFYDELEVLILNEKKSTVLASFKKRIELKTGEEKEFEFEGTALNAIYGTKYRMVLRDPNKTSIISPWGNLKTFTITAPVNDVIINGDLNGDGKVDIADLNEIINLILNREDLSNYPDADINSDGLIDISDINTIINFILGIY